jgi:hypothetical protein
MLVSLLSLLIDQSILAVGENLNPLKSIPEPSTIVETKVK